MRFALGLILLPWLALWAAPSVPYSGKVAIDGINYHGSAKFSFSLKDANGTTHWQNGADANVSIRVSVDNGRYSVMLGGQGMNPLPPELFLQHEELYLSVSFDTGDGPRSLGPEQLITATPRAFVAEVAKVAKVAEKLSGEITSDMLSPEVLSKLDANQSAAPMGPITRDMLPADVLADLNKSAPAITSITRDMLPADVLADLNKTASSMGPITLDMLPAEVLVDLNKTITRDMLPADVLADLNKSAPAVGPITLSMLDAEVTAKLDSNTSGTTTMNNPPAVGSLIAIPYGESAPAGYSLYQQGTPKELVWQEKEPLSLARLAYDGVEVLDGKIYFVGGYAGNRENLLERYDPTSDSWETLAPMNEAREATTAILNGKIYAIGGRGSSGNPLSSVEIYDPVINSWSNGVSLPSSVEFGAGVAVGKKLYLIGGANSSRASLNKVLCYDLSLNAWSQKTELPTARQAMQSTVFGNRIWVIGGEDTNPTSKVESYDYSSDSWDTESSLNTSRAWPSAWVANGRIYVAGGFSGTNYYSSIEMYDPTSKQWSSAGNLPENKAVADAVVLNDTVYVIAGRSASNVYSNKVFAADLNASLAGVYDLYRKDGNASAGTPLVQTEVADGSVTTAKIASNTITTTNLSEQILKYLKPEITGQPKGQVVYADSNVSFSVTAEGKYLTYQWKKDGSDLTGETNSTLTITDTNATQHDGNYSVVVSNDFGSMESGLVELKVKNLTLMNGLVTWWKFDETNGTIAYDSSGNGHDGNLSGGPTWATGKIGGALSFDGVDDKVLTPLKGRRNIDITWSLWIKTQTSYGGMIGVSGNTWSAGGQSFSIALGKPKIDACQVSYREGNDLITTNTWTHCLFAVENSDSVKVFVNGIISIDSTMDWFKWDGTSISMRIAHIPGQGDYYNGLIDDVRIYDRALSAAEVQALYNLGQ